MQPSKEIEVCHLQIGGLKQDPHLENFHFLKKEKQIIFYVSQKVRYNRRKGHLAQVLYVDCMKTMFALSHPKKGAFKLIH